MVSSSGKRPTEAPSVEKTTSPSTPSHIRTYSSVHSHKSPPAQEIPSIQPFNCSGTPFQTLTVRKTTSPSSILTGAATYHLEEILTRPIDFSSLAKPTSSLTHVHVHTSSSIHSHTSSSPLAWTTPSIQPSQLGKSPSETSTELKTASAPRPNSQSGATMYVEQISTDIWPVVAPSSNLYPITSVKLSSQTT